MKALFPFPLSSAPCALLRAPWLCSLARQAPTSGLGMRPVVGPAQQQQHHRPSLRPPRPLRPRTIFSAASRPGNIIRHYEHVPRDYRDQTGLRFSARDLSDEQIARVFGRGLDAATGNRLLRILHGRRVAGTLDDPAFAAHTAQFPEELLARGLDYLRQTVPVNEVLNAGLRAEDELNQMDRELAEREARQAEEKENGGAAPGADAKPEPDPV
ncbi:hypothetical protein E4U41_003243, partial [Claviceps citrina]